MTTVESRAALVFVTKIIAPDRRAALKAYFVEVARELVARGEVRRQAGQTFGDILRQEPAVALRIIQEDFAIALAEVGGGLAGGLGVIAGKMIGGGPLSDLAMAGGNALGVWVKGLATKKKG